MKPAPFDYHAPKTVPEAVDLLARYGKDARPLAGGQSLVPMLALRLARPSALIDLDRIPEVSGIRVADGMLCIGAMTRQADVLRSAEVAGACSFTRTGPALRRSSSNPQPGDHRR